MILIGFLNDLCPGCGVTVLWEREKLVPSNPQLGEPADVLIRYLMRTRVVHKCPVIVPQSPRTVS